MKKIKLNPHQKRMAHRQICAMCHKVCRVDFHVSKDHWELGMPKHLWNSPVCLECYTSNADERFVPWCESITFYPKSLLAELDLLFSDGQIEITL